MTKAELIDALVEVTEERRSTVSEVLDAFVDVMQESMRNGEEVNVPGLGKFEARLRPARTARNPMTGEQVQVAESHVPKFKPASALKQAAAA